MKCAAFLDISERCSGVLDAFNFRIISDLISGDIAAFAFFAHAERISGAVLAIRRDVAALIFARRLSVNLIPVWAMLIFKRVSFVCVLPKWVALNFAFVSGVCFLPGLPRRGALIFALVSGVCFLPNGEAVILAMLSGIYSPFESRSFESYFRISDVSAVTPTESKRRS